MEQWNPATRVAFRFCFVYFGLYVFATQIAGGLISFPNFSFPSLGTRWPMREITFWIATHLFHVTAPLVYSGNSGDTTFHWVQTFWLLVFAVARCRDLVAARPWANTTSRLHKWFRLFVRFGSPLRCSITEWPRSSRRSFPPPSLVTLVEPVGNLSRTDLLWTFIGASTAYQIFTGWRRCSAGSCWSSRGRRCWAR